MSAAASVGAKPTGYWTESLLPILLGKVPTQNLEDFVPLTQVLVNDFRKTSLLPYPEELDDIHLTNSMIEELHTEYCRIALISDLAQRVDILARTRFMQSVSTYDPALFDEEETSYMNNSAFPGAMNSSPDGRTLMRIENARNFIRKFHFAITNPETIKHNVDSMRGLTIDEKSQMLAKRGQAAGWFSAYKEKTVIKDDVRQLKEELIKVGEQMIKDRDFDPEVPENIHPAMKACFESYVLLSIEFRGIDDRKGLAIGKDGLKLRREVAYWKSIESNFDTFLARAVS